MKKGRRFVLGDIHGAHKALLQVFERSHFNIEKDTLIFLGDIADGWPETKACVETLLKVKQLIAIRGNHDQWCLDWVNTGEQAELWLKQGGKATVLSYGEILNQDYVPLLPNSHQDYFKNTRPYYISEDNKCFVHGGFNPHQPIERQASETLWWDRSLMEVAYKQHHLPGGPYTLSSFNEVYIGHTSTEKLSSTPLNLCEVWCMDQGCGWGGKLSLMDIDKKTVWQSDRADTLYQSIPRR